MKVTSLNQAHISQEAKMVEFAGYSMPIQYKDGNGRSKMDLVEVGSFERMGIHLASSRAR